MKVICIDEEAFYELLDQVLLHIKEKETGASPIWISDKEAMALLGISSKTTLQQLRDRGLIEFSQPLKKVIKYNRESILSYLEKHKKSRF